MATPPNNGRGEDEEPTEPMLDEPPGRRPSRPSLAPSLATRISQLPSDPPTSPNGPADSTDSNSKVRGQWLLASGFLIILALGVLIVSRTMSRTETLPVLHVAAPTPVPDPEAIPEPVPDPEPEVAAVQPEAAPNNPSKAEPSTDEEPSTTRDDDPAELDEGPPEHLAIVVHPDNAISSLSVEEVRRIYLAERTWSDGQLARPVGRYRAPALRKVFLELVLGTNHQALKELWETKKSEGLDRVRRLPSDEAVIQYVSKRPEALGYVDWAKLDPELQKQVKLVFEIRLQ